MEEMREVFAEMKAKQKEKKRQRIRDAVYLVNQMTQHTEFHFSTFLQGERLDYWPSGAKWRWLGKTYYGDVRALAGFLKKRNWRGGQIVAA